MKVWEAFFENAFKNMEAEASAGLVFDDRGVSKVRPHRTTTCSTARDRSNRPCFFFKDALTCHSFESFLFFFIFFYCHTGAEERQETVLRRAVRRRRQRRRRR